MMPSRAPLPVAELESALATMEARLEDLGQALARGAGGGVVQA